MPIIEVNHVTKEYKLGQLHSLKTTALNQWRRLTGQPVEERAPFKALDDVNFSIEPGEVVGIIGHNGAGKSTMLKLLANISKPSSGSILVKGKVAPLIEVGAGLVGDLTGRENIYLNGAILGISKAEINRKFDDIVAFAELEEFIDTPIKRYSSGMQVKLGFSIATSVESDILIVDEVLAVGDLAFQRKCFDRMEDLIKRQRKTVLLVSHNIRQVERLCSRVILLDHGKLALDGAAREVCNTFYERSDDKIREFRSHEFSNYPILADAKTEYVRLLNITLLDENGKQTDCVRYEQDMTVSMLFETSTNLVNPVFAIGVHTTDLLYLTANRSENQLIESQIVPGIHNLQCCIKMLPLLPGTYSLRASIAAGVIPFDYFYGENLMSFKVSGHEGRRGEYLNEGFFGLNAAWSLAQQVSGSTSMAISQAPHPPL